MIKMTSWNDAFDLLNDLEIFNFNLILLFKESLLRSARLVRYIYIFFKGQFVLAKYLVSR